MRFTQGSYSVVDPMASPAPSPGGPRPLGDVQPLQPARQALLHKHQFLPCSTCTPLRSFPAWGLNGELH
ncbi:hypothetical protein ACU4GD_10790 [Cupriavidus basilensis]